MWQCKFPLLKETFNIPAILILLINICNSCDKAENALLPKFMWLLAGGHFPIFCLTNTHLLCISKCPRFPFGLPLKCHFLCKRQRNVHKGILTGLWPSNGEQKPCGQERRQTEVPLVKDIICLDLRLYFQINNKKHS